MVSDCEMASVELVDTFVFTKAPAVATKPFNPSQPFIILCAVNGKAVDQGEELILFTQQSKIPI